MGSDREEFNSSVREKLAREAMYICSSPHCSRFTGYSTSTGKARTIAQAAHILPAGKSGPRAKNGSDSAYLKSKENGIWLCSICHKEIDDDPDRYPESLLHDWKLGHLDLLRRLVGKDVEAALLELRGHKRHHQEVREFLSFMDDRRVLFEGMDVEFPPRVLDSLEMMRVRVVSAKAQLAGNTEVFQALSQIQAAINEFLRTIGPATDLRTLKCDSRDPVWRKFSDELTRLRKAIIIILKVLAGDADYELTWAR